LRSSHRLTGWADSEHEASPCLYLPAQGRQSISTRPSTLLRHLDPHPGRNVCLAHTVSDRDMFLAPLLYLNKKYTNSKCIGFFTTHGHYHKRLPLLQL
ncbi:mCG144599, partial [Mus musculus]